LFVGRFAVSLVYLALPILTLVLYYKWRVERSILPLDGLLLLIGPALWTLGIGAFWLGLEKFGAVLIVVGAVFFAWMFAGRYRSRV